MRSATVEIPFQEVSNMMIIHPVIVEIFWFNYFTPSHAGAGISNTTGTGHLLIVVTVDYKTKFSRPDRRIHAGS